MVAVVLQASASQSAGSVAGCASDVGGFCICTDPACVGRAAGFGPSAAFLPVVAHSRASVSVKNSTWVSRAEPPMTTWARPWCLVDFGAGWTSPASMR